jgi:hypothetical protein
MLEQLKFLKEHLLDDLELHDKIKKEILEFARKDPENYLRIYEQQINRNNQSLEAGTVEEFLYACSQPSIGLETECSASCLRGLPNLKLPECRKAVFALDERLKSIIELKEGFETAYYFVPYLPREYELSNEELEFFLKKGFKELIVYGRNEKFTDYIRGEKVILEQNKFQKLKKNPFSNQRLFLSFLAILLILVLLFVVFWVLK